MKRKHWNRITNWIRTGTLAITIFASQLSPLALSLTPVATAATEPNVVINEILADPNSGDEFVELYNAGDAPQDLTGWSIEDSVPNTFGATLSTTLNPGEFLIINDSNVLNNGGDTVTLVDNTDAQVDQIVYDGSGFKGWSYGRKEDGGADWNWFLPSAVTSGTSNVCSITNGTWCSQNLVEALEEAQSGDTVELLADVSVSEQAEIGDGVILDGNGNTLFASFPKTGNSNNSALGAFGDNVIIRNIVVDGTGSLPWPDHLHGINTYKTSNLLLDNVNIKNFTASGLVVNGSTVTVNNINTSGNTWHGINVDLGSGVTNPAVLTVNGVSDQTDTAQIYVDNTAEDVTVVDTNSQYDTVDDVIKAGDRLYTLKAPDTIKPTVSILNPIQAFYNIDNLSFGVKATDENSGIGQFVANIRKNGVSYQSCINQNGGGSLEVTANCSLTGLEDALYQVKTNALDVAGNLSSTLVEEFIVDTQNPRIRVSNVSDGDRITSDTDLVITLDDLGGSPFVGELEIQVMTGLETTPGTFTTGERVYGGTATFDPADETYTFDLAELGDFEDGLYRVRVIAYDEAGNRGRNHRYMYLDNTAPVVSGVLLNGQEVSDAHLRYENCEDIKQFYPVAGEIDFSTLVEDDLSDVSLAQYRVRKVNSNGCSNSSVFSSSRDNLEYSDGRWMTSNSFDTTQVPADGEYTIMLTTRDALGNESTNYIDILIDNTRPTLTINEPVTGDYLDTATFDVTGVTADNIQLDRTEIRVNEISELGGAFIATVLGSTKVTVNEDGEFTYELTGLSEGVYRIQLRSYDTSGNRIIRYVDVVVDTVDPIAAITSHFNGESVKAEITLIGTVEDVNPVNTHFEIRDESNNRVASNTKTDGRISHEFDWDTTSVEDGIYKIYFETRDKAANKAGSRSSLGDSVVMIELEVKNIPPVAPTLVSPVDGAVVNGSTLTNSWTSVSDAVKYVYQSFNDAAATSLRWEQMTASISKTANNVAESMFWWRVKAVDQVENESEWSELWQVTIDNTDPEAPTSIQILQGEDDVTGGFLRGDNREVTVDWSDSEDTNFDYYEYQTGSGWTTTLTESERSGLVGANSPVDGATYKYRVRGIDTAGNVGGWSEWVSVTLDLTAPIITVTSPVDGEAYFGEVSLDASITDNNLDSYSYVVTREGVQVAEGSGSDLSEMEVTIDQLFDTTTLLDGEYVITINATDKAGNSAEEKVITVTVANALPAEALVLGTETSTNTFLPGATVSEPVGTTLTVTKGGQDYTDQATSETGLTEEGEYVLTTTDQFGRPTIRTITIQSAPVVETPEDTESEDNTGGDTGNESEENQGGDTNLPDNQESEGTEEQEGLSEDNSLQPLAIGGTPALASEVTAETPTPTTTQVVASETPEENPEDTPTEDSETLTDNGSDDSSDSTEELSEEDPNGLLANIGAFFGGWFGTWWGWLISILIVLFLILAGYRRNRDQR